MSARGRDRAVSGDLGRWLLALAVRLLRRPSLRRVVFRAVYPPGRGWAVAPPALGDRCVPGCSDGALDWDGAHYCRVIVGRVVLAGGPLLHSGHGLVVEVTQDDTVGGSRRRQVWLLGTDERGRYVDDGLVLNRATAGELGELLAAAFVLAGEPATSRQAAGGAR